MKILKKNITLQSLYLKVIYLLGLKAKSHLIDKTRYGFGLSVYKDPVSKIITKNKQIRADIYCAERGFLCNKSGIVFGDKYVLDKSQYSYHVSTPKKIKNTSFAVQNECISFVGPFMNNYCHFLTHILLNAPLINEVFRGFTILLPSSLEGLRYVRESVALCFPNNPVIYLKQSAFIKRLYKIEVHISRESIIDLRQFIFSKFENDFNYITSKNIFVGRYGANRRICLNQKVIEESLPSNYHSIDCQNLSFKEQFVTFYNAKKIIGVHGAALTNIIFCKKFFDVIHYVWQ
jgi:hypothetical protein